jgi:selenium metabolism protein YedF
MTVNPDLLFVITSNGLGDGEPDLGEKLMGSFLAVLLESGHAPAKMLFLNSGVFLTTQGSPHLELLHRFVAAGTEIGSCGTCLDYYGRRERLAVGTVGNMRDTVEAMVDFKIVRTV